MKSLISVFLLFFVIVSCSDLSSPDLKKRDPVAIDADLKSTLVILLTDAPAVYDSVNITFAEVSAHIDSEWISISVDTMTVNIMEWNNGNTLVLGTNQVPAGIYSQIRLKIIDAEIGVDGDVYALDVPSGAQTGLKLGPEFMVTEGSTYTLVVDFDVNKSIVRMGPPHNPHGYKLKPHLRVIPEAQSGSISGTVENNDDYPVAYAIVDPDTVTSSVADTSGFFRLAFLPEGYYKVAVSDTTGLSFEQDSVYVSPGSDYDLGFLILQ